MRSKFSRIQKLNFLILFLLLLATVGYLKQINNQAEFSFKAQTLNKQKQEKINDIKKISWNLGELRSLDKIGQRAETLRLVKAQNISFLEMDANRVAIGN